MTAKHKCVGKVWGGGWGGRTYKCSRNATIEHGGKWFCWQHDPQRVAKEAAERQVANEAKADRQADVWERRARDAKLAALVTEELAEMLERLEEWANRARGYAVGHWTTDDDQIGTDALAAHALAAQIREALEESDV